jgi:hypothetical protein
MMERIKLGEALARMNAAPELFTLRFMRLDRRRKTGGQITEWAKCRLSRPKGTRMATPAPAQGQEQEQGRLPSHFADATRNLVVGESLQRRKVHIWLLLAAAGLVLLLPVLYKYKLRAHWPWLP